MENPHSIQILTLDFLHLCRGNLLIKNQNKIEDILIFINYNNTLYRAFFFAFLIFQFRN